MAKVMNHSEYQKSLKTKTADQLIFIRADAHEAMSVFPEGENAGYYADEVHYCSMELAKRGVGV